MLRRTATGKKAIEQRHRIYPGYRSMTLLLATISSLVHVNAGLNATATVLLVLGFVLIKRGRETAHRRVMVGTLVVSMLFLGCYLWYHYQVGSVAFTHQGLVRVVYLLILASHVLLAMTVPVLALATIYLGYQAIGCCSPPNQKPGQEPEKEAKRQASYRTKHRQLARWTYPIWLYVSVTGVVVYIMLYHLWPPVDL